MSNPNDTNPEFQARRFEAVTKKRGAFLNEVGANPAVSNGQEASGPNLQHVGERAKSTVLSQ